LFYFFIDSITLIYFASNLGSYPVYTCKSQLRRCWR